MRITQRAVALTSLQGLNRNLDAVGKLQEQLTSGRLINAPSDSPTGTNRAMQTRGPTRRPSPSSRATSPMPRAGSSRPTPPCRRCSTPRAGSATSPSRGSTPARCPTSAQTALATEVTSLREGLLGLANTSIQGRPLFGGVTAGAKAYDTTTGNCAGLAGPPVTRRVSGSEKLRVDITGPEAFGPDGEQPLRRRQRHRQRPDDREPDGRVEATSTTSTRS